MVRSCSGLFQYLCGLKCFNRNALTFQMKGETSHRNRTYRVSSLRTTHLLVFLGVFTVYGMVNTLSQP